MLMEQFLTSHHCEVKPLIGRECFPALLRAILTATSSIYFTVFQTSNDSLKYNSKPGRIVKAILDKHNNSLDIKILINLTRAKAIYRPNKNLFNLFYEHGIPTRRTPSGDTVHGKVLIVDKSIVIIGSHNLTTRGLWDNYEASIMINSPDACRPYVKWFDWLYARGKENYPGG